MRELTPGGDFELPQRQVLWRTQCANCMGFLGMGPMLPFVDGLYALAYDPNNEPRVNGDGLARRRLAVTQPVFQDAHSPARLGCLLGGWVDPASEAWLDLPFGSSLLWFAVTGSMTPVPARGIGTAKLDFFRSPNPCKQLEIGHGGQDGDGELAIVRVAQPFQTDSLKTVWNAGDDEVVEANRLRIGGEVPYFAIAMAYVEFREEAWIH